MSRILILLERICSALERLPAAVSEPPGEVLLTYEDVGARLGSRGKPLSRRQVERIQVRHPSYLRKIRTGNRGVRFRPADVDRLIAHLADLSGFAAFGAHVEKRGRRRL